MRRTALFAGLLVLMPLPGLAFDDALWAQILQRHTQDVDDLARVRVDYAGLRDSSDWKALVASLGRDDPDRLGSRAEILAFWINAYNILAIDLVVQNYPVEGIRDIGSIFRPVWKRAAGTIGGRAYSLDLIEHEIVRPMGDPRTHAALVCASLSCPPLLREPWRAASLSTQLDAQVRTWLADPRKGLRLDRGRRAIHLSRIFEWFEGDFEASGGVLAFVASNLPEDDAVWLRAHPDVRVVYFDYDWSLNDLATR